MTTIQLTDAQLAQFTATGLIVVDGIPHANYADEPNVAPPFWRKLTDPCPTCDGEGIGGDERYNFPCPNPDCAGGRQVVTLTATCPVCRGNGVDPVDIDEICAECLGNCRVTLGRFAIRLLPVVGPTDETPLPSDLTEYVWSSEHGASRYVLLDGEDDIQCFDLPLDPLPHPGQWAVQFEAVPS